MSETSLIGKAVPRVDALAKARGQTAYVIDMEFPGTLAGAVLRSPLPHAKIARIDTSQAERLRGVKAVVTAADFPASRYGLIVKDQTPLARDRVRYVGEKVAAVAAVDQDTALEALALIVVEYEPLEAVLDPQEALRPEAPLIHEDIDRYAAAPQVVKYSNVCSVSGIVRGDVEEGFAQADFVFEDTYTTSMAHQGYLEPRACIAQVDGFGKVTLRTPTPSVFRMRDDLATILGMPTSQIKVLAGPVGGSFGGKNELRLEHICVRLAQKAGCVVKMAMDREEEFADGSPRHASVIHLKTGVMKDGRIIARQARMVFDTGAYAEFGPAVSSEAAKQISGPYRIPHLDIESLCVYTNKVSCGCVRCHGTPQPTFAYESQMDVIAERLGLDPLQIRLKNALVDGESCPTGEVYEGTSLRENLRRVADHVAWGEKPAGPHRGRGIACGQWRTGGRPTTAILKLDEHGKVSVTTGCVDVTGTYTLVSQVVAEELGLAIADIQIIPVDTDNAPFDAGSSGTRTTHNVGGVVWKASRQVRQRIVSLAAEMLEANVQDLELGHGRIYVKGAPEKGIPIAAVAQQAFRTTGGPIIATESTPGSSLAIDPTGLRGLCYSGGVQMVHSAQVADVEVDPETGRVKIIRFASAHDVGRAINPANVTAQIEAAVVQGIGYALTEEICCADGVVLNPSGAKYAQPTSQDATRIDCILIEDGSGLGPYGAKGVAEAPIITVAPAIANAIYDAVGVRIKSLPITPDKILEALREKEESTRR